ncbi:MAG: site-2 protease family protein [Armatimonadetes bacterium]|nr:site-2 protease family protein [Armatimonadota bacterium]
MNPLTIFAFLFELGVLVLFHEFGHFAAAKLLGVRVEEFSFGLGPRMVRLWQKGDTEYTIHWVPFGGFVKLSGMEVGEENIGPDGFNSKPTWARMVIIFAGPFMSIMLAFLVFSSMGMTVGFPTGKATNEVEYIMPDSRAQEAGLQRGDEITGIIIPKQSMEAKRRYPINNGEDMLKAIHGHPNRQLVLEVNRKEQYLLIGAKTTAVKDKSTGKEIGLLGFIPVQHLERQSALKSIESGFKQTVGIIQALPKELFNRNIADKVGGPIAILQETSHSVDRGFHRIFWLIGVLSLTVGLFNLFPLPLLDGGYLAILTIEAIRGKRLRPETQQFVHTVGFALLMLLFVVIMYNDLMRLASGKTLQ